MTINELIDTLIELRDKDGIGDYVVLKGVPDPAIEDDWKGSEVNVIGFGLRPTDRYIVLCTVPEVDEVCAENEERAEEIVNGR